MIGEDLTFYENYTNVIDSWIASKNEILLQRGNLLLPQKIGKCSAKIGSIFIDVFLYFPIELLPTPNSNNYFSGNIQIHPPTDATKQMLILRYLTPMGEYQEVTYFLCQISIGTPSQ